MCALLPPIEPAARYSPLVPSSLSLSLPDPTHTLNSSDWALSGVGREVRRVHRAQVRRLIGRPAWRCAGGGRVHSTTFFCRVYLYNLKVCGLAPPPTTVIYAAPRGAAMAAVARPGRAVSIQYGINLHEYASSLGVKLRTLRAGCTHTHTHTRDHTRDLLTLDILLNLASQSGSHALPPPPRSSGPLTMGSGSPMGVVSGGPMCGPRPQRSTGFGGAEATRCRSAREGAHLLAARVQLRMLGAQEQVLVRRQRRLAARLEAVRVGVGVGVGVGVVGLGLDSGSGSGSG